MRWFIFESFSISVNLKQFEIVRFYLVMGLDLNEPKFRDIVW